MLFIIKKLKILVVIVIFFIVALYFLTPLFMRTRKPPEIHDLTSIEFYSDDGTKFSELTNNQSQNYTELKDISPYMIDAILSVEDKDFYSHNGLNYPRIVKALFDNIIAREKKFGASTITQQYARNLYLSFEKTYIRKIKEAYYAYLLEANYDKDAILEGYLNTIYFGHGVYGVSDGARYYFNKSIQEITLKEATILAATIKAPTYYSPVNNPIDNEKRSSLILSLMLKQKRIEQDAFNQATEETVKLVGKHPQSAFNVAPYFQDMVVKELESLHLVKDEFYQGVKVYTTLDLRLNDLIVSNIDLLYSNRSSIETAVYAINPKNGHVKSVVGGRDYPSSQFNRATQGLRHPGSTIKPLLYYKALEVGFTPSTTLKSEKTTFYLNNLTYSPTNFRDDYANDYISLAYALATSDNIYAVKTHLYLGQKSLIQTAKKLGITTDMEPRPSLALGATDMKLSELTTAYAHFANMGVKVKPTYITKVTNMDDEVLYKYKPAHTQVLDPDITFVLNHTLTSMFDPSLSGPMHVTGESIASQLHNPYSGKSGSTDFDNWMIGYNPYLVLGVWTGYDEQLPLTNSLERGYSKRLWANVMSQQFAESYDFFEPTDFVVGLWVNPITGRLANKNTKPSKLMYYMKGSEPYK